MAKRKKKRRKLCPKHGDTMRGQRTRYGIRFQCQVDGCSIACWNGPTSLPGDDETRALRQRCHAAFDPLWRGGEVFQSRQEAYRWLKRTMLLPDNKAHIGMMDKQTCIDLLGAIAALKIQMRHGDEAIEGYPDV